MHLNNYFVEIRNYTIKPSYGRTELWVSSPGSFHHGVQWPSI